MNIIGPQACPVEVYKKSMDVSDKQIKLRFDMRFQVYPGVFQSADHVLSDIGEWVNKTDLTFRPCETMGELI